MPGAAQTAGGMPGRMALIQRLDSGDVEGVLRELLAGRGADVVYDPVGGPAFRAATKMVAFEGRVVVVGFTSGELAEAPRLGPQLGEDVLGGLQADLGNPAGLLDLVDEFHARRHLAPHRVLAIEELGVVPANEIDVYKVPLEWIEMGLASAGHNAPPDSGCGRAPSW